MTEVWKPLEGVVECGDNYEISNTGKVKNISKGKMISVSNPVSDKRYPKATRDILK